MNFGARFQKMKVQKFKWYACYIHSPIERVTTKA